MLSLDRHPGVISVTTTDSARNRYRHAEFLISAPNLDSCPPDSGAEIAFAGRSNAGKSSAINALTGQSKLARTSKTPGRTQLINFFDLGDNRRLVDLPGYGFAQVPLAVKQAWQRSLEDYLQARASLAGLVVLMDIRHPLQERDRLLIDWATAAELPVHAVLTKADKLKRGGAMSSLHTVEKYLQDNSRASAQCLSALKKTGLDELAATLDRWFAQKMD